MAVKIKKKSANNPIQDLKDKKDVGEKNIYKDDLAFDNHTNTIQNEEDNNQEISPDELKIKFNSLELELEDWKNKAIRYAADFQNFQKEVQTQSALDISQTRKATKKSVLKTLLPFITTLDLAIQYAPSSEEKNVQKFVLMLKSSYELLIKDLQKANIEIIKPAINSTFDPIIMESLSPSSEEQPKVSQVVSLGLKIDDYVIQPSVVMLA